MIDLNCQRCPLSKYRTQVVPGYGPPDADFLLLGEGPGREEDEEGLPFIGGSGRLLRWTLWSAGYEGEWLEKSPRTGKPFLNTDKKVFFPTYVYIDNIVRCRPPNNRNPEPEEIAACSYWTQLLIEKLQPKKIITTGDYPSAAVTAKATGNWRGMIVPAVDTYSNIPTLITVHSARAMRQRSLIPVLTWDLKKALVIEAEEEPEPRYESDPPLISLKAILDSWEDVPVAVDIETIGDPQEGDTKEASLNPYKGDILGIAFCGEKGRAVEVSRELFYSPGYFEYLTSYLSAHPYLVWHHGAFDRYYLAVKGVQPIGLWYDTKNAMYAIYSDTSEAKLDFVRSLYTNIEPYKENYVEHYSGRPMGRGKTAELACKDVDTTLRAAKVMKKFTDKLKNKFTGELLMDRLAREEDLALKMKLRGVLCDEQRIAGHYARLLPRKEELEALFARKYGCSISSDQQVRDLFYGQLNIPIPPHTKRGKKGYSIDKKTVERILASFVGDPPEKRAVLLKQEYNQIDYLISHYCEGLFKRINDTTGRVHTSWKVTGTDTGRWSSVDPNLMGVTKPMRDIVVATPHHVLFGADYDRIEVWIAALISRDPEMLALLKDDVDIHQAVLNEIQKHYDLIGQWGPVQARLRAKAVVFGTFYGRSPRSVATEFGIATSTAEAMQQQVFYKFPRMVKFFREEVPALFEKQGYVETVFGRRKYAETLPQAMNAFVQSTAVDVVFEGMFQLDKEGFRLVLQLHDGLVSEEPNIAIPERLELYRTTMERAAPFLNERFPVKAVSGNDWLEVS